MNHLLCLRAAILLALLPGLSALPARGQDFHGMGSYSEDFLFVTGVSRDGSVLIGFIRDEGFMHAAFRWTETGGLELLGVPAGSSGAIAYAASRDGSTVVGTSYVPSGDEGDPDEVAFVWTEAGGIRALGRFPYPDSYGYDSDAVAVSADGSVVGGHISFFYSDRSERWANDVIWNAGSGGVEEVLEGCFQHMKMSADASIVVCPFYGELEEGGPYGRGVRRWNRNSGGQDVIWAKSDGYQHVFAISADGSTLVGYEGNPGPNGTIVEAVRWTEETGPVFLGYPSGARESRAEYVSGDGSVVVGEVWMEGGGNWTFIWTEDEGMRDLRALLEDEYGLDLTGWQLTDVTGISDDGRTIVGVGINPDGEEESWRAVLPGPAVTDLRFVGGTIREAPFEGASARLSRNGAMVELQLTDSAGVYTFTEELSGDGYELEISDTEIWGVSRGWTDLTADGVYRKVRLPATMMVQLDALADSMAARHYDLDAVRALFRPYEHWADTSFTGDAAQVDTALARLIIAHQVLQTMYENTRPVSKELATALAELTGFAIGLTQTLQSMNSTMANRNMPVAQANRFNMQAQSFAATMIFDMITKPIVAAMPSSPPELKLGLEEFRRIVLAQMQAALANKGIDVMGLIKSAAVRVGASVGEDVLMKLYQTMTQEELDRAAQLADGFSYTGETQAAWRAASDAGIANFTDSDDAASFSELTRGTATEIDGISGIAGAFTRTVALARVLRLVQLAGYISAIGRTGYQFYDTAENDLPHAIDLAFHPAVASKRSPKRSPAVRPEARTAQMLLAARGGGPRSSSAQALEQAIEDYLREVDELVGLVQSGQRAAFIERVPAFMDAVDAVMTAASNAQLPILAAAEEANARVEGFEAAQAALSDAFVHSGSHHLALSAYILGYLDGEASGDELAAQADTVRSAFEAVVPRLEAVSALLEDLPIPAFVAVTEHGLSVDSVKAGEPVTVSARIRNGGGLAGEDVVVRLVPDANMHVSTTPAFDLGELGVNEERVLEWTVVVHDTATVGTYEIRITSSNAKVLPAVGGFAVASGSVGVNTDDGPTIPGAYGLEQNYPNPFSSETVIRFDLPRSAVVRLTIYDVYGREVRRLVEGERSAGRHEVTFRSEGLASGIYFYRLEAGDYRQVRQMVLVR